MCTPHRQHYFAPGVIAARMRAAPRWQRAARTGLRWAWRLTQWGCVLIVLLGAIGLARQAQGHTVPPVQPVHLACEGGAA